ncbi:glycolipid transfer protein-domain-containing protein [Baffinella frigidus]|nr:glycolipid transfer protein-domain-containing protein [Cryptophyta sp. CCMP2293]
MPAPFFPEVSAAWTKAAIVGGEIPANEFMDASKQFTPIFDRLGKVFFPVKADLNGNVEKLVKHLAATPAATLHAMIRAEKAAGKSKEKNSASGSLLWLKRAMQFVFCLLKRVSKGEEANKAAQEAYKETLMAYHGFMVKKTSQVGLMAALQPLEPQTVNRKP